MRELTEALPLAGNLELLEAALNHMARLANQAREVRVFRLYYGISDEPPKTLRDVGAAMGMSASNAGRLKTRVRRRLMHPNWKDKSRWPKLPIPEPMPLEKIGHIAIRLATWRLRSIGTEQYVAELKRAAEDLGISDEEMRLFYNAIGERMVTRR